MTLWDRIESWVVTYGARALGALATLIIGYLLARLVRTLVRRFLRKAKTPEALQSFGGQLGYAAVLIFAVIASLARFGVQTTSFVAVLGAISFAIGFALQGSLSNFAAGVLILVLRPFRVGDVIEAAGVLGTVKDIQLFVTIVATPDNVKALIPNAKLYGDTIHNLTGYKTRRIDLPVGIGYGVSIERASTIALRVLQDDPRILSEPAPEVLVSELADSSVNLTLRMWVDGDDYWPVTFDVTRSIKEAFDREEIEIPFPQQVIHAARE